MIIFIAIYENRTAYKIEAVDNDDAYDKAYDISHEINSELVDLYSLSFKKNQLIRLEV